MARSEGGPAFAHGGHEGDSGFASPQEGMTLRDWFAGQALAGAISSPHNVPGLSDRSACMDAQQHAAAQWAYEFADAMIAERAKRSE